MDKDNKIIVALDFSSADEALRLVDQLMPSECRLKVGHELFTRAGPTFVGKLVNRGYSVFLDLKFHDIPNTVSRSVSAAAELGVWMTNVHAFGGVRMMTSAKQMLIEQGSDMLLIAVTVLTSMDFAELAEIGVSTKLEHQVLHLARQVKESGLDGVVCSAQEARLLRTEMGKKFSLVTPGIRLLGDRNHDQRRVVDPRTAVEMGSDYLVIGRAITRAEAPLEVLRQINQLLK